MKIVRSIEAMVPSGHPVVTAGTFDGVHLGHQKILSRLREIAAEKGGHTLLITYHPHPRLVVGKDSTDLFLLTSLDERLDLLAEKGLDQVLVIPFTPEFSQLSGAEYIQRILQQAIGTQTLVIGYDHRFGRNREGSLEYIQEHAAELGFAVEEIPRFEIEEWAVSSTRIRKALEAGDLELANRLLGHPYRLYGTVISGDRLGRTIGYPTANLQVDDPHKLIPKEGIYAVRLLGDYAGTGGMLYIGKRPVVQGTELRIEVNLFDFHQDIYGQTLKMELVAWVRADKNLPNLESLKAQLAQDELTCRALLGL